VPRALGLAYPEMMEALGSYVKSVVELDFPLGWSSPDVARLVACDALPLRYDIILFPPPERDLSLRMSATIIVCT